MTELPSSRKHSFRTAAAGFFSESRMVSGLLVVLIAAASIVLLVMPEDLQSIRYPHLGDTLDKTVSSLLDFSAPDFRNLALEKKKIVDSFPHFYRIDPLLSKRLSARVLLLMREVCRRAECEAAGREYTVSGNEVGDSFDMTTRVRQLDPALFRFLSERFQNNAFVRDYLAKLNEIKNTGILSLPLRKERGNSDSVVLIDDNGREFESKKVSDLYTPEVAAGRLTNELFVGRAARDCSAFEQPLNQFFRDFVTEGNLLADKPLSETRLETRLKTLTLPPIKYTKGSILVRRDKVLDREDVALLKHYGEELKKNNRISQTWRLRLERIALSFVFLLFTLIYLSHIHPELVRNNRSIWLLGTVAISALLANRLFASAFRSVRAQDIISPLLVFLALPLSLPALVISAIYGLRSAIFVTLFVSGITAIAMGNSFEVLVTGLLVSAIAGYAVRKTADYKKFFMYAFLACASAKFILAMIFVSHVLDFSGGMRDASRELILQCLAVSILSSILTAMLALIVIFLLESFFDVVTNMSYLTLQDRNHPLLKRLQLEAPGTYHHCERVASLVEPAADEIHANSLRVQACALYHDIGKLSDPAKFTENAFGMNVHDGLNPLESARIIKKHVSYGMELARKYKLKSPILRAIQQHHGTDFISFFYGEAQKDTLHPPREEDFRYDGPVPEDREIAILMLADCSEAAFRCLDRPSPETIQKMLNDIFTKKLQGGQLDHTGLTITEIAVLKKSFLETLVNMGHVRVAYPPMEVKA